MSLEEKVEEHRHTEERPGENVVKKYPPESHGEGPHRKLTLCQHLTVAT